MSTVTLIWIVVAIALVAVLAAVGYIVQRRRNLRERFGPEYARTVNERDSRVEAEQELRAREKRFAAFDIKPLAPDARQSYAERWNKLQERFVDSPAAAVSEADQLVQSAMAERGYPTESFDQQVSDLSVVHGRTMDHYRRAHDISDRASTDQASTEELRQAMVHYRALFEELLDSRYGR